MADQTWLEEHFQDRFDHMVAEHDEHHESLAGQINGDGESLLDRWLRLETLHMAKHGIVITGWSEEPDASKA